MKLFDEGIYYRIGVTGKVMRSEVAKKGWYVIPKGGEGNVYQVTKKTNYMVGRFEVVAEIRRVA